MRYVALGDTEVAVSSLCLGTWQTGGAWTQTQWEDGIRTIRRALEQGINFFDTAASYGLGNSERMLGEGLREALVSRRDEVVIATKGGLRDDASRDCSGAWLRQQMERSLSDLGVDYVDIYLLHWPDPNTPFTETADALNEFLDRGWTRYVGVSNFDRAQMDELGQHVPLAAIQPPYHLFRREAAVDVIPYAGSRGMGVFAYAPQAHGLLSGAVDASTTFAEGDWRCDSQIFAGETFRTNLRIVEALREYAVSLGLTIAQLSVAWVLAHPEISSTIVGAMTPEQVEALLPGAERNLKAEELQEIESITAGYAPVGGPAPEGFW
jgi:aryl-alcohol dehydrogenase-like predicted oxidoreductase